MIGGPTFGPAQQYQRVRPGWPAEAITALVSRFGARTVLDLAAGTRKLTEVLDAAAELTRVVRPGGGVAVLWNVSEGDDPAWMTEIIEVVRRHKLEGAGEIRRDTVPWRQALEAEPRLGPLCDEEVPNELRTDRERTVAMIGSWSSVASLPDDRRATAIAAVGEVLDRHDIDEMTIPLNALITSAERLDG